jgi:hypothetical protein
MTISTVDPRPMSYFQDEIESALEHARSATEETAPAILARLNRGIHGLSLRTSAMAERALRSGDSALVSEVVADVLAPNRALLEFARGYTSLLKEAYGLGPVWVSPAPLVRR